MTVQKRLTVDRQHQQWTKRDPSDGLPAKTPFASINGSISSISGNHWTIAPGGHAGVGFFRTNFDLKMPTGHDVMMSIVFEDPDSTAAPPYRAFLFVNGWMMGKRVGNLG